MVSGLDVVLLRTVQGGRGVGEALKHISQYAIKVHEQTMNCLWCGEPIVRGTTLRGKPSWFDAERDERGGYANHWTSCVERKTRKKREKVMSSRSP